MESKEIKEFIDWLQSKDSPYKICYYWDSGCPVDSSWEPQENSEEVINRFADRHRLKAAKEKLKEIVDNSESFDILEHLIHVYKGK